MYHTTRDAHTVNKSLKIAYPNYLSVQLSQLSCMNCKLTHLWDLFLAFMVRLKCLFTNLLLAGDSLSLTLHEHEYDGHIVKAADKNFLHPNITMHILPTVFRTFPKVLTWRVLLNNQELLSW